MPENSGYNHTSKKKGLTSRSALFPNISIDGLSIVLATTLFNTSLLTGKFTEVEDAGSANGTIFVNIDLLDEGRCDREDTLYTNSVGNLTDSKGFSYSTSTALDNNALEILDTFFVSFFDFIVDSDGIASLEFGELFKFDQILYELH